MYLLVPLFFFVLENQDASMKYHARGMITWGHRVKVKVVVVGVIEGA